MLLLLNMQPTGAFIPLRIEQITSENITTQTNYPIEYPIALVGGKEKGKTREQDMSEGFMTTLRS